MSYDTIILNDNLWNINGKFTDDIIAGMLAVINTQEDYYLTVGKNNNPHSYSRVEFIDNDNYIIATESDYNKLWTYNIPNNYNLQISDILIKRFIY